MDNFTIRGHDVAAMRRMFTHSQVIILGTMQWRVFELTQLLNGLIARQDIFADVRQRLRGQSAHNGQDSDEEFRRRKALAPQLNIDGGDDDVSLWEVDVTSITEMGLEQEHKVANKKHTGSNKQENKAKRQSNK